MQIKIVEINVEKIDKGKTKYSKAVVRYSSGGSMMTQNVMSFSNPDTFKKLTDGTLNAGDTAEVDITKNDAGYNQWAKITKVEGTAANSDVAVVQASSAPRSNYETRDERAARQVMIVKQSSLGHALEYLKATAPEGQWGVNDVIETAQEFVDYVFGNNDEDLGTSNTENT